MTSRPAVPPMRTRQPARNAGIGLLRHARSKLTDRIACNAHEAAGRLHPPGTQGTTPFAAEGILTISEGRSLFAGGKMLQMEIDHIGSVAHQVSGEADVGAVEMKPGQIAREADTGGIADDDEVFIQRLDF